METITEDQQLDLAAFTDALGDKMDGAQSEFLEAVNKDKYFIDAFGPYFSLEDNWDSTFEDVLSFDFSTAQTAKEQLQALSLKVPSKPPILDGLAPIRYKEEVYSSSELQAFEESVKGIVAQYEPSNGYRFEAGSLEDSINNALYDLGFALDVDDLEQDINQIAAKWANDGYQRPCGSMSYEISTLLGKYDRERTSKTDSIFKELSQTIQMNIQKAFELGISLEGLHMAFANSYSKIIAESLEKAVDVYVVEIEKIKNEFAAQLSGISLFIKRDKLEIDQVAKRNDLELTQNLARLNAHIQNNNATINSQAQVLIENIKLASNIADGYSALFSAHGGRMVGIRNEQQ